MASYIVHRLLLMIPTLLGITLVVFFTMALSPGGVAASFQMQARGMRPEQRQALRAYYNRRYGLNDPYIQQYGRWLNRILPVGFWTPAETDASGWGFAVGRTENDRVEKFGFKTPDLGVSYTRHQPVSELVGQALPITLLLNIFSIPVVWGIAIIGGIYAARKRGRAFDVGSSVVFLAMWSAPVMWVGVMAIGLFANREYLYWFPTGGLHATMAEQMPFLPAWTEQGFQPGWLVDLLWHLVLPVIVLSLGGLAFLAKLMRSTVLESMGADFVRTARAKGVSERDVLWQHVFRNSLLPLITVAATLLPALLSGSLIVEVIFSLNGMGKLLIEAIRARDREIVLSVTFVMSIITLLSFIVRDVLYALVDPRVSFD